MPGNPLHRDDYLRSRKVIRKAENDDSAILIGVTPDIGKIQASSRCFHVATGARDRRNRPGHRLQRRMQRGWRALLHGPRSAIYARPPEACALP